MMNETIKQWSAQGYRLFGLHPIRPGGRCGCGNPECRNAGKHPAQTNWQKTPRWDDEQLEVMFECGDFETGWGAQLTGLLVVDIDPRNGGERNPEWEQSAGLVVATGGGGWHYFFRWDQDKPAKTHKDYKGVDFLAGSGHYVVGAGSQHKSGGVYKLVKGSPEQIGDPPDSLKAILLQPAAVGAIGTDQAMDHSELRNIVMAVKNVPGVDFDKWLSVGMGIHQQTGGSQEGLALWTEWSAQSAKHVASELPRRWRSFAPKTNGIGIGTLRMYAMNDGWVEPVTFDAMSQETGFSTGENASDYDELDHPEVDLLNPPGVVGEVAEWIDSQCLYPRRRLAVAAALATVGDIGGLHVVLDDPMRTKANLLFLGVAESSTGKEAVLQARTALLSAAGMMPAHHGGIKSEQEMVRNLTRHQASIYSIDEVAELFGKLDSAKRSGGAIYLEGIIGFIMSAYSKSNGIMGLSGDLKESLRAELKRELRAVQAAAKNGEMDGDAVSARELQIGRAIEEADNGLSKPFLSMFGLTTPLVYSKLISVDNLTNGFLARTLIVEEADSNPKGRKAVADPEVPFQVASALGGLSGGTFGEHSARVEAKGEATVVRTDQEGVALAARIADWQFWKAEREVDASGLTPIWRRHLEMVNKVSLVLAMPTGVRTREHIWWAHGYVMACNNRKIHLGRSKLSEGESDKPGAAAARVANKILAIVDNEWVKEGQVVNRCRSESREAVKGALTALVTHGMLEVETRKGRRGPASQYYRRKL